jgi:oligopeptide ABC superfamily ATP binding cassette transporter, membrane protein
MAVFADFIAPYSPTATDFSNPMSAPSAEHIFGTDRLSRDIFSRMIHGLRMSLFIGLIPPSINLVLGALLGMLAGLSNKWIDMIIMRLVDIALSYPFMILAMAIIYNLGPGMMTMMFALVVLGWASSARIIRAQTKMIANETYVDAAKSMGLSRFSVMKAHILPNIRSTLIVIYTMEIPESILAEAGLSFLGFGAQAPMTSLGVMVSDGRSYVFDAPWMSIAPGIFILLLSLSFNFLGDELRDYFGLKGGSKL